MPSVEPQSFYESGRQITERKGAAKEHKGHRDGIKNLIVGIMAFFSLCPLCSFAAPSSELKVLIGDRTQRSGGYEVSIFGEHAAGVSRFGWSPRFTAFLEFGRRDLE